MKFHIKVLLMFLGASFSGIHSMSNQVVVIKDSEQRVGGQVPAQFAPTALAADDLTETQSTQLALIDQVASIEMCTICQYNMVGTREVHRLRCGHQFHATCLVPLMQERENARCPNCRAYTQHPVKRFIKYHVPTYLIYFTTYGLVSFAYHHAIVFAHERVAQQAQELASLMGVPLVDNGRLTYFGLAYHLAPYAMRALTYTPVANGYREELFLRSTYLLRGRFPRENEQKVIRYMWWGMLPIKIYLVHKYPELFRAFFF